MPEPIVKRIIVDLGNAGVPQEIAAQGDPISSIFVASMPAGVTQFDVKVGDNEAVPMLAGDTLDFGCNSCRKGLKVTTQPALPGQIAVLVCGGNEGTVQT